MIECVFTIDYEIYGSGEGSLKDLVHDPTERLMAIFRDRNARFVPFVEVAELEMLETYGTDRAIELVKRQIRELDKQDFELGLHIHPQWYNARYEKRQWLLDFSEWNLCVLSPKRITQIIERSLSYLRNIVGKSDYTPLSYRAGNWLFQPSKALARVLFDQGIRVDSSLYKGGVLRQDKLDYRKAVRNGYYWRFQDHIDIPQADGLLLEVPIYTQMVPFWKMANSKRIGMQWKSFSPSRNSNRDLYRLFDFLRFRHPLKLDFCRMSIGQITEMLDRLIREDRTSPDQFKPIVAIGHTKDLVDFAPVEFFLTYLTERGIAVSTFKDIYPRCMTAERQNRESPGYPSGRETVANNVHREAFPDLTA